MQTFSCQIVKSNGKDTICWIDDALNAPGFALKGKALGCTDSVNALFSVP